LFRLFLIFLSFNNLRSGVRVSEHLFRLFLSVIV
jgi:hypothetical protein